MMLEILGKLLAVVLIIVGALFIIFTGFIGVLAAGLFVISLILLIIGAGWFWFIGMIIAAIIFWFRNSRPATLIFRMIGAIIAIMGIVMLAGVL